MDGGDFLRDGRSILQNALLLTGVNLLLRGVSMLFQIYLSGQIGAGGIGLLQLILTVGSFAMTVGLAGLRTSAMYLCAEEHGKNRPGGVRRAMRLCLACGSVISCAAAAALYGFSLPIAERFIHDPRAAAGLRCCALTLPLDCLIAIVSGYFTACGKIRRLVTVEVAERLASLGATYVLLRFWARGDTSRACCAILLGGGVSSALALLWLLLLYRRDLPALGAPARGLRLGSRLRKLCIPLALSAYLRAGLALLEQFLIPHGLARHSGNASASMAVYGTICGMVFPILMFPAAIIFVLSELLVPELARCSAAGSRIRVRHLTEKCLHAALLYAASVAALLFLLAPQLGRLLYQRETVGFYLRQFAPMAVFLYLDAIVDGMCKGLGQQVACVRYNTITAALDAALLYVLLPLCGIVGYQVSFVVTHLVNFYLSLRLLLRLTHHTPQLAFLCKAALCVLCGMGASLCAPAMLPDLPYALVSCAFFLLVFLPFLRWTGLIGAQEQLWLRHMLGAKTLTFPPYSPKISSKPRREG